MFFENSSDYLLERHLPISLASIGNSTAKCNFWTKNSLLPQCAPYLSLRFNWSWKILYTCIDCSGVMSRIIGTKSPPWKLLLDPIVVSTLIQVVIDQVVTTHGWIGVGPAYQKLLFATFQLDQHSNVILAVILKNREALLEGAACCDTYPKIDHF